MANPVFEHAVTAVSIRAGMVAKLAPPDGEKGWVVVSMMSAGVAGELAVHWQRAIDPTDPPLPG